jgi:Mg-chelatase subunit ChlD
MAVTVQPLYDYIFIRLCHLVPPAILSIVMLVFGWFDAFHLTVAATAYLIARLVALLARKTRARIRLARGKINRDIDSLANYVYKPAKDFRTELARAVAQGVVLIAAVALVSWVASLVPGLQELVLDRDRTKIELKLEALEQAGYWPAATDLITERLHRRTSRVWRDALHARLYSDFVQAGAATSGDQAQAYFQQAHELADQHGLNKDLAAAHLERLILHGAVDREKQTVMDLAKRNTQHEGEHERLTTQLVAVQREKDGLQAELATTHAAADRLEQHLTQARSAELKTIADQARMQFTTLIAWGDSLEPTNPLRKAKYHEADTLAKQHALDRSILDIRFKELEQAAARSQPAPLPSGARGVVHRIDATTYPPLTIVDFSVQLPAGDPVLGLATKDFAVHSGKTTFSPLAVYNVMPAHQPIQLVLLFDHSISSAGPALAEAKAGSAGMLKQLQGIAHVKAIAFATKLSVVSEWSENLTTVATNLQQLNAEGNTALRQAIAQAIADLEGRSGPKAIILFTDGRDTVGGPSVADLIARCRKLDIVIHAVALETAELDRDALSQLTLAIGGILLPTSNTNELPQRFLQAIAALHRPYYRLVMANLDLAAPWEIVVGGDHAVRLP